MKTNPFKVRKSKEKRGVTNYSDLKKPTISGKKAVQALVREAFELQDQVDAAKRVYGRLDELVAVLAHVDLKGTGAVVVDAFAEGSKQWKSVPFNRYKIVRGGK